ncbi:MAG: YaaA family protein [Rhodothermales bacterium]|nr:YaaA family protein [Rhodothermales bacterium]
MPNFSILLAPAESKVAGGNPLAPDMFDYRSSTTFNYFHELNAQRRELINSLQGALDGTKASLEKLFGVKGAALKEIIATNSEIFGSPLMSALERYSPGVMYKAMDFSSLPTGAQRRLLENGIILSGLFGLLRPDDLIPNYRLKMDSSIPKFGKVSAYWKKHLSPSLNRTLEGQVVWNLLPGIHQDAWEDTRTYKELIAVKFVDEKKGKRSAITQGVKPLRGKLVNFIVSEMGEDVEALNEWKHPAGYVIDLEASSFDEDAKRRTITMVRKVS